MSYKKLRLANALQAQEHGTYLRHFSRHAEFSGAHTHDYVELFWVEKGPGVHWINREAHIVEAGTLQLVRADDVHTLYALPGYAFEWTNVAFPISTWTFLRKRYFADRARFFDVPDPDGRKYLLPRERVVALRVAAAELAQGARSRVAFERFLLNALAQIPDASRPSRIAPGWLVQIHQDLRQQANFGRGVASVIASAGRCPEHVCREYRRHYGRTPTETITLARMEFAAFQLENTDMKIVDLALEVGLENLGHFYRVFQKHFGCTPRDFRMRTAEVRQKEPPGFAT
jgi:AraC family cel operon transcriptional repressor